ncbi:hypothetical protein ACFFRR_010551 [Megaselia abdita]
MKIQELNAKDLQKNKIAVSDEKLENHLNEEQKPSYFNVLCNSFLEYCDYSSIIGLKYLGERKRPVLEKVFWILVFFVLIYAYIYLTLKVWVKWNDTPVIVTFDDKSSPVWKIPFPAVTICSEVKVERSRFNFSRIFSKFKNNETISEKESFNFYSLLHVCDTASANISKKMKSLPSYGDAWKYVRMLDEYGIHYPNVRETFVDCVFKGLSDCNIFYPFLTEEGICFTFNSPNHSSIYREESHLPELADLSKKYFVSNETLDWSLEEGYKKSLSNRDFFPFRTMGAGIKAGLTVELKNFKRDFDSTCRNIFDGFKILIHTPGEIPRLSNKYLQAPMNQQVLISVKPTVITTSKMLKNYDPKSRQCYFENERYLRFFKVYTQTNCELECLTNYTLARCKCVAFSMPRNIETKVCGPAKIGCYKKAEYEVMLEEFQEIEKNPNAETKCNCLPACTSITYDAEISNTKFTYDSNEGSSLTSRNFPYQITALRIFFKENQYLASSRSELYGLTDFLANVGGLLGLFLGISAISLAELVYFVMIRFNFNLFSRKPIESPEP